MPKCDVCGYEVTLPRECSYCGGTYCEDHRLPEAHDCPGLDQATSPQRGSPSDGAWGRQQQTGPDFDGAPYGSDPDGSGIAGYFKKNMTFVFLMAMWLVFGLQLVLQQFGVNTVQYIALDTFHVAYVWTWITAIFAHGGFAHIAMNSIVLYFFGPLLERRAGSKSFTLLFIGSGVLAGLGQILISFIEGAPTAVVGASGAILAVMGAMTVLNPNLRVLLFFIIPMPLWVLTIGFAMISVFIMVTGGVGLGGIAHGAHLLGLLVGLVYGRHLKKKGVSAPQQLQFGGGRRRGPGGRF
ncbi:rhomboid family intramembrane serine protease [Salinarchaeum sp. IM2453]|uniref:rhomboid family intramembrane serine protease n=1 Tax=Salinarchaeum sp. IM2453 TaxID=2862870 RepID=UPI001C82944F|nr:rhomboid family intramembrane serine protease [Salinarchaeum sp. IM2453]QZA88940.1 rhomboid family intramembrane serine protease [Salinarchaeum sp. IM2453]